MNGVALTSRQFREFARRSDLPFLCVYGGGKTERTQDGSVTELQLKRGPLAVGLDKGLWHDPFLWRFRNLIVETLREFEPDLIHVTSPGDVGELGALLSYTLGIPLAASWHTNFHEFGAERLRRMLMWAPQRARNAICDSAERAILRILLRFYKLGNVLFAPNEELAEMVGKRTGKPTFVMKRGVDTHLYDPAKRTVNDGIFRLGYVGRVTPEKSVRFLVDLERALLAAGARNFRFLVVGDGSEREWLAAHLQYGDLPGVLRGEDLAHTYANMDLFVFPSRTDTFGNVVQEALASGVPAVVTDGGGPKFIVRPGYSGFVAACDADFTACVLQLIGDTELHGRMRRQAREQAFEASWDIVFEKVYHAYEVSLGQAAPAIH